MIVLKERTFFFPKCSKGNKKRVIKVIISIKKKKKKKKKRTLTNKSIIIWIEKKMYELSETQKEKKLIIHNLMIH